ncbi:anti-sigma factor antagonist [Okeania sp. KiyG1]|uniref:STAS domain-containing protein n=1 Tax=Okeania sp. KiyG1 TaxID=2720165 RepID=UPI0019223A70
MEAILFRPQGNLNLKRSYQLKQIVGQLIDKTRNFYCIIDLGLVNKINNFGLTTLVIVRKISEKRGCLLYLFNIKMIFN